MKKRGEKLFVFFLFISLSKAGILVYTNFENGNFSGWLTHPGEGEISVSEDPPYTPGDTACFRRENHGVFSIKILTESHNIPTYMVYPFPQLFGGDEYLVEFYINIPMNPIEISNFWIYRAWRNNSNLADIEIKLTDLSSPLFTVEVADNEGTRTLPVVLYADTIIHPQNWYRFQIYKNNQTISLYINGEHLGDFTSISGSQAPDSVGIGTIEGGTGEILFDDFFITTPPQERHPRLFFSQEDIPTLQTRRYDRDPGELGISYATLWDTIEIKASRLLEQDTMYAEEYAWPYPFPYPPPTWHGVIIQALYPQWIQYLSFTAAITGDTTYAKKVKEILLTVGNWVHWEEFLLHPLALYAQTPNAHITINVAIGYDFIFNFLTPFERMSIQNSLITHGIEQLYLALTKGVQADPPYASNKQIVPATALGLAILALNVDTLYDPYLRRATEIVTAYLSDPIESYDQNIGCTRENLFYGGYTILHVTAFSEVLKRAGREDFYPLLSNHMKWRITCLIPSGLKYIPFGDSSEEMDLDYVYRMASEYENPVYQWYIYENRDYLYEYGLGIGGDYFYFSGFLWMDKNLEILSPDIAGYPLGELYKTTGWAIMRTGWEEDDLLFGLSARDNGPYHSQSDNNSVVIGYKGKWFIGENQDLYFKRKTSYHNTLLVDTLEQVYSQSAYNVGVIETLLVENDFAFTVARAESSYKAPNNIYPLKTYRREAFLLFPYKYLIIQDFVEADSPHKFNWYFHTYGNLKLDSSIFYISFSSDRIFSQWMGDELNIETEDILEDTLVFRRIIFSTSNSVTDAHFLITFIPYSDTVSISIKKYGSFWRIKIEDWVITGSLKNKNLSYLSYNLDLCSQANNFVFLNLEPSKEYYLVLENDSTNYFYFTSLTSSPQGIIYINFPYPLENLKLSLFTPSYFKTTPYLTAFNNGRRLLSDSIKVYLAYTLGKYIALRISDDNFATWNETIVSAGNYPTMVMDSDTLRVAFSHKNCLLYTAFLDDSLIERKTLFTAELSTKMLPPTMLLWTDTLYIANIQFNTSTNIWVLLLGKFRKNEEDIHWDTLDIFSPLLSEINLFSSVSMDIDEEGRIHLLWTHPIDLENFILLYCSIKDTLEIDTLVYQENIKDPFIRVVGEAVHIFWVQNDSLYHTKRYYPDVWKPIDYIGENLTNCASPFMVENGTTFFSGSYASAPQYRYIFFVYPSGYGWSEPQIISSVLYKSYFPQGTIIRRDTLLLALWTSGLKDHFDLSNITLPLTVDEMDIELENKIEILSYSTLKYQNPSRENPSLRLMVPYDCYISLKLYDVSGRLIKTIHQCPTKKGSYNFFFPLERSGVYFIRLTLDNRSLTYKWIYIRK